MQKLLIENSGLKEIVVNLFENLCGLGYSEYSLLLYRWVFHCLDEYMYRNGKSVYTSDIGESFLEYKQNLKQCPESTTLKMKLGIRRLNEFINLEYKMRAKTPEKYECPKQFSLIFEQYLQSLRERGLKENPTISSRRYYCLRALVVFGDMGINNFSEIKASDIYSVFEKLVYREVSLAIRRLFQYLFEEKITEKNLALYVPTIKRKRLVPTVYTKDETEKFLESFDRTTPVGKRNYAIMLLALRLGIRKGDICNLKISDIDFKEKTINFIQQKTDIAQNLALLPEIEEAINSYLHEGRQDSDIPNIFLTMDVPIRPFMAPIHVITTKHFKKAGINVGERKHGPHALRSTLASELVMEKVPYDVVRKILGHEDPVVVNEYVNFDIESLRPCALAVPPLSGKIEKFMSFESGVVL